jgi:hypothetical protein
MRSINIKNMLFNNQFIICNQLDDNIINKYELNNINIDTKRYIYYKSLNIEIYENGENKTIIIGYCLQSDPEKSENLSDIFMNDDINIIKELSTLVGNYTIIHNNIIYKDYGNLQKLYLYKTNNETMISNNAMIFSNLLGLDIGNEKRFGGNRYHFCLPGKTCYSKVSTLFNSQNITINGEILHNKLLKNELIEDLSLEQFVKKHTAYCCQIVTNLYNKLKSKNKKLYLTLTGGKDSRMVLAIALYLKIPFEVITLKINHNDLRIAQQICKTYNLKHTIIDYKSMNTNENIRKKWNSIIGYEYYEQDHHLIQKEALEQILNNGDCIIFANGPEWVRKDSAPQNLKNIHYSLYESYINWIKKYPEDIAPDRRRFIEIRIANWLGSIQQSYDMCVGYQRFCFPICEKIVANSFCISNKISDFNINQRVINELVPELNNIIYN